MNTFTLAPLCAVSLLALAACGGGSSSPQAPFNSSTVTTSNEIVPARADVSRAEDGRILLRMTAGPMDRTTILCADARLGACQVVGGPAGTAGQGTLLERYHGQFAFAGNFSVMQLVDGNLEPTSQLVHAAGIDSAPGNVRLPQGVVSHTGRFSAGAGLADGPQGMIEGDIELLVDFNMGVLGGTIAGGFESGESVQASFNNVTINASNGQFAATYDTLFMFQSRVAGGDMRGAFYGPNAQETAGVFDVGNDRGGMSGIFLTCQGTAAGCIRPDPAP